MKIALILLASWIFPVPANAQKVLPGKEIYRANCKAVVQIYVNGNFSGNGFIASADGIVMTANHVATTRESGFRQYAGDIRVLVNGNTTPYQATPLSAQVSDDQVNYDSAILKITASQLPHVTLGKWDEIDVSDLLTIMPSWPDIGCILLEGTVANRGSFQTPLGPKPVNTILFQSPVRNGFSGAPIFSPTGHVVGIVDTKVFGISPALDFLRNRWASAPGGIIFMGINIGGSFLELINNLDQNLISGLGSGVAIEYAKKQQEAAREPTTED